LKINFETLAASVKGLIDHLGLNSYVLYMQDFGGPVGFRIFAERPGQIAGFVIQNTNAYMEGVGDMPRQIFLPLWEKRDEASEAGARQSSQPEQQNSSIWSAPATPQRSAPITGPSTRPCWTARALIWPSSICWRTTRPMLRPTIPGMRHSARIGPER
jgi:pimeloyl-ACP methyl ester carboxylesterase